MRVSALQEPSLGRYVRNFVLRFTNLLILGSTPFILSKLIGIVDYGAIAYFISIVWVGSAIGTAGLDVLSIRVVSGVSGVKRIGLLVDYLKWSHTAFFVIQSLLFLTLLSFMKILNVPQSFTGSLSSLSLMVVNNLLFIFIAALFLALTRFWEGILIGLGLPLLAQLPRLIILPGGFILLAIVIHVIGYKDVKVFVMAYVLMVSVAMLAQAVQIFILTRRYFANSSKIGLVHSGEVRVKWLRSLAPLSLFGLLSVLNDRIGLIILGSVRGPMATGSFDLLFQVAKLAAFPLVVATAVYGPLFSRVYERSKLDKKTWGKQRQKLDKLLKESAKVTSISGILMVISLILAGSSILSFVSKNLTMYSLALDILLLGQLMNVAVGPIALLLNMTGKEAQVTIAMSTAVLLSIGLGYPLAKLWSVTGMAVASMVSMIVWNLVVLYYVNRFLGISPFPRIAFPSNKKEDRND